MDISDALSALHPQGDPQKSLSDTETGGPLAPLTEHLYVETFGGRMHIEWDADAPFTAMGQLSFFIEFLHTANLFNPWVEECPLAFTSPNASNFRDILGTMMLSVLAGHWRYAHATRTSPFSG